MIDLTKLTDADLSELATQLAEEIDERDAADEGGQPAEAAVRASTEATADYML